jgi:acyl-CoA thioester hydrolase
LAGRLVAGGHVLPLRVYYEDTDFAGIVYHANYLRYCERGRSDYLRLLGIDQTALHQGQTGEALNFVVVCMALRFITPALMDDVLGIETRFAEISGVRLRLDQTVKRGDTPLFTAEVEIVLVNAQGKPRRFPEFISGVFKNNHGVPKS